MIFVIATVEVVPGKRDAFLAEFRQLVPKVHAEVGCIEYGPALDAETDIGNQQRIGSNKVMVVEKWESVAALKAHIGAPHMLEYRGKVKELVVSTTLQILEPV
jgi:quinol monooxygenase YgiN